MPAYWTPDAALCAGVVGEVVLPEERFALGLAHESSGLDGHRRSGRAAHAAFDGVVVHRLYLPSGLILYYDTTNWIEWQYIDKITKIMLLWYLLAL